MDEGPLTELAERQLGLIRTDQAAALGLGLALRRSARLGRWERVTTRVYRRAGAPRTERQAAMVAVLDASSLGASLSHHSSASVWGVPGFTLAPHHVTLLRSAPDRRTRDYVVHQPRLLLPHHLMVCDGLPVTSPARTLFDLAGCADVHDRRLERALDTAWSMRLVSFRSLLRTLDELARKGRPGIARMRVLIDARGALHQPPASGLEARFLELAARAGLTDLRREVDLGDDEWIGRVDVVHDATATVFEIDSDRFHAAPLDAAADRRRDERLAAAGYKVRRFSEFEVWHRGDEVVEALLRHRWQSGARPDAAA